MKLSEHLSLEHIPVVYGIHNILTDKWYIGSTYDIRDRFIRHLSALKHNRHHSEKLQRSFNKYGIETFEISILYQFNSGESVEEMLTKEEEFIQTYNSCLDGYNILSVCKTPGRFFMSDESKQKAANAHKIGIISINRTTGIVEKYFSSITEAAKYYSGSTSNISQVCKGKLRYSYGRVFVYENDYDPDKDYRVKHHCSGVKFSEEHKSKMSKSNPRCKAVEKISLDNKLIETYYSIREAEIRNGIPKDKLRHYFGKEYKGNIYRIKI